MLSPNLNRSLDGATSDEKMLWVFAVAEQLVDAYLKIAALNREFHVCCKNGTLPKTMFV
jgi:hypothetical protein